MHIVTGLTHSGKTTFLKNAGVSFASWDEWFRVFLQNEGRDILKDVIPLDILQIPYFTSKFLAINPHIMGRVCEFAKHHFVLYGDVRGLQFAEVPLYALSAIRPVCDSVIRLVAPDDDTLIERYVEIRQCSIDEAMVFIAREKPLYNAVQPTHEFELSQSDLLTTNF